MSVTPTNIWEHAQTLPQNNEVEIRTKISRLYYALFSHACEFNSQLPEEGHVLRRDVGSHHQLSQKLTNPTVKDPVLQNRSRELGTKQKLTHELRVRADYDLDSVVDKVDLAKCIRYVQAGMAITAEIPATTGAARDGRPTLTRIR